MAREPKSTLPVMSDEEVKDLATRIYRNEVFTDRHIDPREVGRMLQSVFMPLAMMDRKTMLDMKRKQRPGMFWAEMSAAGPRAINGYPMFFELRMVSEDDTKRVWEEYDKIAKT